MDVQTEFKLLCRANAWKCTPQRLAVYDFVNGNLHHPSVDEVWEGTRKKVPTITRESVYRILNEFAAAGVLMRLDKVENAHYDAKTLPHGHLVCENCGEIRDFELASVPKIPSTISKKDVKAIELRISWICPECKGKNSSPAKK